MSGKGKIHPPDCRHCATVRKPNRLYFESGNLVPFCSCHHQPMRWAKNNKLQAGGHYRCKGNNYTIHRDIRLKKMGITEEKYGQIFDSQNGVCAICKGPPDTRWKMLAVDHDHGTGKVRGLLCMTCNTLLGRLESQWDSVMQYLGKTK